MQVEGTFKKLVKSQTLFSKHTNLSPIKQLFCSVHPNISMPSPFPFPSPSQSPFPFAIWLAAKCVNFLGFSSRQQTIFDSCLRNGNSSASLPACRHPPEWSSTNRQFWEICRLCSLWFMGQPKELNTKSTWTDSTQLSQSRLISCTLIYSGKQKAPASGVEDFRASIADGQAPDKCQTNASCENSQLPERLLQTNERPR